MIRQFLLIIHFITLCLVPADAQAPFRIGVCDCQRLITAHPEYLRFQKESRQLSKTRREGEFAMLAEIRGTMSRLENLRQTINQTPADDDSLEALKEQEFNLSQQIIVMEREIHDQERDFNKDLMELIEEKRERIISSVFENISIETEKRDINLLLDLGATDHSGLPLVLFAAESLDFTPWFLDPTKNGFPTGATSPKVAMIDMRALYDSHPEKSQVKKQLEEDFSVLSDKISSRMESLDSELKEMRRKLERRREVFNQEKKGEAMISQEERAYLEKLFTEREQLNRRQQRISRAIQEKSLIENRDLKLKMLVEIKNFAQSNDYDLILNKSTQAFASSPVVAGTLDSSDITFEVQEFFKKSASPEPE